MENDLYELIEEDDQESEGQHNPSFKETALVGTAKVKMKHNKKHKKKRDAPPRMTHFERRYSELAIEKVLIPERKRIDFVLVHSNKKSSEAKDKKDKMKLELHEQNREKFESMLLEEGFSIQVTNIGDLAFKKLHCPFKRLCHEAEKVKLEMPLKDCENPEDPVTGCFGRFIENHFETDNEVDFVSSQFYMDKIEMYENHQDPSNFFRPAQRSLLVNHILINVDIRSEVEKIEGSAPDEDDPQSTFDNFMNHLATTREDNDATTEGKNRKVLKKKGLPYLLMKGTYTDYMILHENSKKRKDEVDEAIDEHFDVDDGTESTVSVKLDEDPRHALDVTWTSFFKFQPLWKIRNYFGEKIAFYFAWSGLLISSLWIPTLLGIAIFIYGIIKSATSATSNNTSNTSGNISTTPTNNATESGITQLLGVFELIKGSFDNDATPYFGLIICLWGTIFLEYWKRKRATLAYEWDVEDFESKEPDRPQFYGTQVKKDPVTREEMWFYPFKRKFAKIFASSSVLIFMMLLVVISVLSVIIYRVIMEADYCGNISGAECLMLTTVISSFFNAVSILLLGKVYDRLAVFLTEWENHRTQTAYDDSLIIKLFAFQFVNSYASCFYIAFLRENFGEINILGDPDKYKDDCDGTCMSQLSFQVLVLMIMKPFPKLLKDIILPFLKKLWMKRPDCCRRKNKVGKNTENDEKTAKIPHTQFLKREYKKPSLGDFTLGEYTEKVIQYGFLMLFAASFPLAPLLALVTNLFDIRVDAKRMLWWYRRPIAFIAQDIGMWYDILYFVNIVGVITNAFLIAFTSSWGKEFSVIDRLWIVIGFEHIVFALKYVMAAIIPDVPTEVKLAIRREKYQIAKKLEESRSKKDINYRQLYPGSRSRNPSESNGDVGNFMVAQDDQPVYNQVDKHGRFRKKDSTDNIDDDSGETESIEQPPWYITDPSTSPNPFSNYSNNGERGKDDNDSYPPPPRTYLPLDHRRNHSNV